MKKINKNLIIVCFALFFLFFIFSNLIYNQNKANAEEVVCHPQIPIGEAVEKTTEFLEILYQNVRALEKASDDQIKAAYDANYAGAKKVYDIYSLAYQCRPYTQVCWISCDLVYALGDWHCTPAIGTCFGRPCPSYNIEAETNKMKETLDKANKLLTDIWSKRDKCEKTFKKAKKYLYWADETNSSFDDLCEYLNYTLNLLNLEQSGCKGSDGILETSDKALGEAKNVLLGIYTEAEIESFGFNQKIKNFSDEIVNYQASKNSFKTAREEFLGTKKWEDFVIARDLFASGSDTGVYYDFKNARSEFQAARSIFNSMVSSMSSRQNLFKVAEEAFDEIKKAQQEIKKIVEDENEPIDLDIADPMDAINHPSGKLSRKEYIERKLNKARFEFDNCYLTPLQWEQVGEGLLSPKHTTRCRTVLEANLPRKMDLICEGICLLDANSDDCKKCRTCKSLLNYFCCQ